MNFQFGAGLLYGVPNAGNQPTLPTPFRLLLQEVSVDLKGDLKKLWAQEQFPIAKARGKIDITGKAKIVNLDPDPVNQFFFAQSSAAGMSIPVDKELATINVNTFTVTVAHAGTFEYDNGVSYAGGPSAGAPLLNNNPTPAAGQYAVNTSTGVYTFNSADGGIQVYISYTYTNATRGKTITITNQLMGYAPELRMDVWNIFRTKVWGLRLNSVVVGSWNWPSKLEDFWVIDINFDASADSSDNIGKLFADTF